MFQESVECPNCGYDVTVLTSVISPSFSTVAAAAEEHQPQEKAVVAGWQCLRCGHKFATEEV
jgi:DNA-directed RNA polymerase subunit RPC12/RpoP